MWSSKKTCEATLERMAAGKVEAREALDSMTENFDIQRPLDQPDAERLIHELGMVETEPGVFITPGEFGNPEDQIMVTFHNPIVSVSKGDLTDYVDNIVGDAD